jgi:hypothetical protein
LSRTSISHRVIGTLLLCGAVLAPIAAHGQVSEPQNVSTAHILFDQAVAEMEAGEYEKACKKLEEVTRLLPRALGAKLDLGDCYEKTDRVASAWAQFMTVNDLAQRDGEFERAQLARQRAESLRPRLAMLLVEVPPSVRKIPGVSIKRDGQPLGEAQWGTALPADAGAHEVEAIAPGYKPWTKRVEGVENGAKITVTVEALVRDPEAAARPTAGPGAPVVIQAPPNVVWQRPAGIAATGAGGAILVAGLITGGIAISTKNTSNEAGYCDRDNRCNAEGLALRNQAVSMGNVATGLVIGGAALATGGALLWVLAPKDQRDKPKDEKMAPKKNDIALGMEFAPGGIGVRGAW